jgi:ATP-dependent DNA helicase RecQ
MMMERAKQILKAVFGYDHFISLQREVVENVLGGRDTLAVMPTGGGKSLCYQLPALIFDGLTIVVSPLISLMKDQVEQLSELAVPAVLLNSSLSPETYRSNVAKLRGGDAKLLYVAPETLLKASVGAMLEALPVSCLAIDEAHCISEWGPDFRPEYRQLAEVRTRFPESVCIALTATATPRVRKDIKSCLGFGEASEFVASFNRENLLMRVEPKEDAFRQVMGFLHRFSMESGIIYCLTRKRVDALCAALRSNGFSASPYHAGLTDQERSLNQERFVKDEVLIMVATIAFGMGINKSDIRFVLHHDLPKSIESYYQEIGRAGRDGLPAECLLLYSYADVHKMKPFIDNKAADEKRAAQLQLDAMVAFAEAEVCRRLPLLSYFGETYSGDPCGMCDNCLAGEREKTDVTIPVQKFLSCVKRTGERFGALHIIDVLLGSKASKVLQWGHDRLSTYKIGRELSREQWQRLARQLLQKGLLTKEAEFGGLRLAPAASAVLRGTAKVFCTMEAPRTSAHLPDQDLKGTLPQRDPQLFEILRQKRRELAEGAKVPPFVIFSDRTLTEIAAYLPQTPEDLLQIQGIGNAKLEKYGAIFMTLVADYCRHHPNLTPPRRPSKTPPTDLLPNLKKRHHMVGEAFNSGQSVEQLAEEWRVKHDTILEHLYTYFQEGHPLRSGGVRHLLQIPDEQQQRAMQAFAELGLEFLRPVFEALNQEVNYEDLKIIRLHCLSLQAEKGKPTTTPPAAEQLVTRRIICLANSRKYSGWCVAGKEFTDGLVGPWIRPVSDETTGELAQADITLPTGKMPGLLDIIGIRLRGNCPHTYQTENHLVTSERWSWHGILTHAEVPQLCDEVDLLWVNGYHSRTGRNDRMPLELARGTLSSSLLFICPDELCISVEEDLRGLPRVRARFNYRGDRYRLAVTDPVIAERYIQRNLGDYPVEGYRSFLTVSISEPFEGFCYKLIAAVILHPEEATPPDNE